MKSIHLTKATPKEYVLKLGKCEQCGHCCKYGAGYVLQEDIKRISSFLGILEDAFKTAFLEETEHFNTKVHKMKTEKKKGKPYGSCVFFQEGNACMIHDAKPFHCRIGTCSEHGEQVSIWFMLNYLVNPNDPESVRQYSAYLKTHPTIPGGALHELVPDKEKLAQMLDYRKLR
jgi:Fe-S-cluster containining protein